MTAVIYQGDALETLRVLPAGVAQTCITSPPYWGLRDYEVDGQLGLEPTVDEHIERLVGVFRELWRVLTPDATLWLNVGDSYATDNGDKASSAPGPASTLRGNGGPKLAERFRRKPSRRKDRHPIPHGTRRLTTGVKPKDLMGIPWLLAFALREDGWFLRADIVWHKPNAMPESAKDRPTRAHDFLFLFAKQRYYYYDADAIAEEVTGGAHPRGKGINPKARFNYPVSGWASGPGNHSVLTHARGPRRKQNESFSKAISGNLVTKRNRRDVWSIPTYPYKESHHATFPPSLVEPCILAGSRPGDTVIDCFAGACTTGLVARRLGRNFLGVELSPEYVGMGAERIRADAPLINDVTIERRVG